MLLILNVKEQVSCKIKVSAFACIGSGAAPAGLVLAGPLFASQSHALYSSCERYGSSSVSKSLQLFRQYNTLRPMLSST